MSIETVVEVLGAVSGVACVFLAAKKNIWTWPIGLINILCYLYIFWGAKLYADFGEQIFYLATTFLGWGYWIFQKSKQSKVIVHVQSVGIKKFVLICVTSIVIGIFVGTFLRDYTDASYPYVDAITTILSFAAQFLLTFKRKETWIIWIAIDIVALWLYTIKGLYVTTGLYVIYLANAVYGLKQWEKDYHEKRNSNR